MKRFKIIACMLVVVLITSMMYSNYTEIKNGKESVSTAFVSDKSRTWITDNFGDCQNIEELLLEMAIFARENFNYFVFDEYFLQHFNFDEFLTNMYTGCCYDFSVWAKTVVLVWSDYKNIDVQAFVLDIRLKNNKDFTHSFNHFIVDGKQYCADFTYLITTKRVDFKINDYIYRTNLNYSEIAEMKGYEIFAIH